MKVELDIQEREIIKLMAKQMAASIRRDTTGGGKSVTGLDAAAIALYERLVNKMDGKPAPASG